jgi:hypothetical protein
MYDGLDIIFEDLSMLDVDSLERAVSTKNLTRVSVVKDLFTINTVDKTLTITGYQLNDSTYFVPKQRRGDLMFIGYDSKKADILTGIEYVYHMYKNLNGTK